MGSIILLALAAAVYPQLLAVVVIILTRPNPQPLLWACYLASLLVSVAGSVLIFAIFRSRGSVAGTSSHRLGPAAYLAVGAIAVLVAILMATRRGRELFDRDRALPRATGAASDDRARWPRRGRVPERSGRSAKVRSWSPAWSARCWPFPARSISSLWGASREAAMEWSTAAGAMVVFALIKFILIEVPIAGYTIDRDRTAVTVSRFSGWMQTNKLAAVAAIVGLFGIALIGRGISGLG